MGLVSSISPNIGVNTQSAQLRVELSNAFNRMDGMFSRFPLILDGQNGPTGNTGAAETDLFTHTIETGTLSQTATAIHIFACGTTSGNANNKTLKLYFGSTIVFNSGAIALNNKDWVFEAQIVRTGGATQTIWGKFQANGNSPVIDVSIATEDLTLNKTLKITGTGTTSADINAYTWKVVLLN